MADGSHPLVSDMVPVVAVTPPRVVTGTGSGLSASRLHRLGDHRFHGGDPAHLRFRRF